MHTSAAQSRRCFGSCSFQSSSMGRLIRASVYAANARNYFISTDLKEAGGSAAAGHLSCAAKKGNPKKAAPGVAPRIHGVPLRCLPRWGDCATRPGEAHTTCLTAGLEQCSSNAPHRAELLGAPQGEKGKDDSPAFYECC